MNTFHDLARRVSEVAAPTLDVDGLIAEGEQRLHRRRMTAVLQPSRPSRYRRRRQRRRKCAAAVEGPVDKPNKPDSPTTQGLRAGDTQDRL